MSIQINTMFDTTITFITHMVCYWSMVWKYDKLMFSEKRNERTLDVSAKIVILG